MTNYTVRVELHDAKGDDYDKLHDEMRKQGFSKRIKIGDDIWELPTAEYSLRSDSTTKAAVLKKAEIAAKKVQPYPQPSILVTASSQTRAFSGLKKV
ncbi:DUF2622 domain-containing protein [Atlantibacter hermannii]|uniref:DUF2622 domain-containing protein n=1 Tax=Atlantibacter hermannii TaxID=565 RepID=UPI002FF4F783